MASTAGDVALILSGLKTGAAQIEDNSKQIKAKDVKDTAASTVAVKSEGEGTASTGFKPPQSGMDAQNKHQADSVVNSKMKTDAKVGMDQKRQVEEKRKVEQIIKKIECASNFSRQCSAIGPIHTIKKLANGAVWVLQEANYSFENKLQLGAILSKMFGSVKTIVFKRSELSTEGNIVYQHLYWPDLKCPKAINRFIFVSTTDVNTPVTIREFDGDDDYDRLKEISIKPCLIKGSLELLEEWENGFKHHLSIIEDELSTDDCKTKDELSTDGIDGEDEFQPGGKKQAFK